jgi:cysteine-rich repeat protein
VCVEAVAPDTDAYCGACESGYHPVLDGTCEPDECATDANCAPVEGPWAECGGFAGECGESGTQSRQVNPKACRSGQCIVQAARNENRGCTRETDGAVCGDGGSCAAGVCVAAVCGDGVVQTGEACDDGNGVDTDGCRNNCQTARCGDGVVQTGESCDDGNSVDTDGCRNNCQTARCGDGVVRAGIEACDDGNGVDTDGCRNNCQTARCGDGVVQTGVENCDGADLGDQVCEGWWDGSASGRLDGGGWYSDGGTLGCASDCQGFDLGGCDRYWMTDSLQWREAEAACVAGGGHLVTIASATENRLIFDLVGGGKYWIGLNDRVSEVSFVWASGETARYRNWYPGEPNDNGNQDCAQFYGRDGTWDDDFCDESKRGICEAP